MASVSFFAGLRSPAPGFAELRFDLTPGLSVSEEYDDNIYLSPSNEESDYITTVTPSLTLGIVSQHTDLLLNYTPSFIWYDQEDLEDYVEHSGSASFGQELSDHLKFNLSDTFLYSRDPLSDTEDVQGLRTDRNKYWRNTGRAGLDYRFGPESSFNVGYGHSHLENDDPTIDDGRIQTPSAGLTYWFNVHHGVQLDYDYTKADFWVSEGGIAGDDYTGHGAGAQYFYRFSPQAKASVGYRYTTRDFDGAEEDYEVHDGSLGYDQSLSETFSFSLGGGYFKQVNDVSDDETGYNYRASLNKRFRRGSFSLDGAGGWDEQYLQADRRGFTRYWSGNATFDYQLLEPLNFYANGSYRRDKDAADRVSEIWRGNCGLSWTFLRWFSAGLSYTYTQRIDDLPLEEYTDNRVMLTLGVSRLFTW